MIKKFVVSAILLIYTAPIALAVEGGFGLYQLGSRDIFAGIVPAPGIYWNNDFFSFRAAAPVIPIGGFAIKNPKIVAYVYKFNGTMVFPGEVFGGRVGLNVNVPLVSAKMDFNGVLGGNAPGILSAQNKESGIGDISINPLIGWHYDKFHYLFSMPIYLPTGKYNTASANIRARTIDVLSLGKNRFGFDPTIAGTFLDPEAGFEISGALGITFNTRNSATKYQSAPELHFESTIAQHLPIGVAIGGTFYAYQQLANDSGTGARNIQRFTGASTLKARVLGAGPVISYATKLGNVGMTLKFKYLHEFAARRRFESNVYWGTMGLSW